MARLRMAEGGEAKRATDRRPKPCKPRSGEQTKPEELQRPAPNEARSSRSRVDRSGKLPPEPEAAEAASTEAESCRRSPKQPKPRRPKRKAAAEARSSRSRADRSGKLPPKPFSAPCRPSSCLCALFHVAHLFCIVPRETLYIVK